MPLFQMNYLYYLCNLWSLFFWLRLCSDELQLRRPYRARNPAVRLKSRRLSLGKAHLQYRGFRTAELVAAQG